MKKKWFIIFVLVVFVCGPLLGVWVPNINCRRGSLDVLSGETRSVRYIWFVNVGERVGVNPLAEYRVGVDVAKREWIGQGYTSYGFGTKYACSGINMMGQSDELAWVLEGKRFSEREKRLIVSRFFELWAEKDIEGSEDFVERVVEGEELACLKGL